MRAPKIIRLFFIFCSVAFGAGGTALGRGGIREILVMYAAFLSFLCVFIRDVKRKSSLQKQSYIELLLVSAVIPDNYIIIFISLLWPFVFTEKHKDRKYTISKQTVFIIYYLILNIIVNQVRTVNIFFFLLYIAPFYSLLKFFRKIKAEDKIYSSFLNSIYFIITSQLLSIITCAAAHISAVRSAGDMDWVSGTLGTYQCNVLMFICVNFAVFLLNDYINFKRFKSLVFFLLSLAISLSTTSLAYTLVLLSCVIFLEITNKNIKLRQKIYLSGFILFGIAVFITMSQSWVVNEVAKLFSFDYIARRVTKIYAYVNVFRTLPREYGLLRSITGCGVGQYSSRAALTCSGTYVNSYSSFFPVSVSEYKQKYILSVSYSGTTGLASNTMSSIVSIQGELGLIGTLVLLFFWRKLFRMSRSFYEKLMVLFFIGIMFVDNSIEFAKYCVAFWLSLKFCSFAVSMKKYAVF